MLVAHTRPTGVEVVAGDARYVVRPGAHIDLPVALALELLRRPGWFAPDLAAPADTKTTPASTKTKRAPAGRRKRKRPEGAGGN